MATVGQIKIRDIKELQAQHAVLPANCEISPLKKRKYIKSATTSKKLKGHKKLNRETVINDSNENSSTIVRKTAKKRVRKSALIETPLNQRRIDSYFTSCPKTYCIKFSKEETQTLYRNSKAQTVGVSRKSSRNNGNIPNKKSPRCARPGRKRLFTDSAESSAINLPILNSSKGGETQRDVECITIDSASEEECYVGHERTRPTDGVDTFKNISISGSFQEKKVCDNGHTSRGNSAQSTISSPIFGQEISEHICGNSKSGCSELTPVCTRRTKSCPPYKIIENTTFAVDAFQFGYIESVTHYFLTHFHADHYIGLTKSFAMPIYVSPITARLLRTFIKVQDEYINEIELNKPCVINGIEVTALDANHCPGAVLFVFKFENTGKCILHTGDFRANHEMESQPIFWNNDIHTIYLDTTYISDKYAFCTQYESIMKAEFLIEKLLDKHSDKRILYICGSYIIGKEKFWSALAERYELKVWAEGNRYKALRAIDEDRFNRLLVEDPHEANMHVIPMGKVSYLELVEYYKLYEQQYDVIVAIRPSGWEKSTKPRYGGKINIIGIEYSEHSSYEEMQRFVKFLKPEKVISTVPSGRDLMKTSKVPVSWYKYDKLKASSSYQPSIDSLLGKATVTKLSMRLLDVNESLLENIVSPLKVSNNEPLNKSKSNLDKKKTISIASSNAFESSKIEDKVKRVIKKENYPKNVQTCERTTRSKTRKSAANYVSESNITSKEHTFRKNLQCSNETNNLTQTCTQRIEELLGPNNTTVRITARNAKEYFPATDAKPRRNNKLHSKKQVMNKDIKMKTCKNPHNALEDGAQAKAKNNTCESLNQVKTTNDSTESNNASHRSTLIIDKQKPQQGEAFDSKLSLKCTRSQQNKIYKSISTDESRVCNLNIHQGELYTSCTTQKRITRSRSSLIQKTTSSIGSQNNHKTLKHTESRLNTNIDITLNSKQANNSQASQENPILKSTTESSVCSISADEFQRKPLKTKEIQTNSPTNNEFFLDELKYQKITVKSKRGALNHCMTHSKKIKPSVDAQTILNNILEHRDDVDQLHCSQLTGFAMESENKQNPDYSTLHIPADLLSDADDDWM